MTEIGANRAAALRKGQMAARKELRRLEKSILGRKRNLPFTRTIEHLCKENLFSEHFALDVLVLAYVTPQLISEWVTVAQDEFCETIMPQTLKTLAALPKSNALSG